MKKIKSLSALVFAVMMIVCSIFPLNIFAVEDNTGAAESVPYLLRTEQVSGKPNQANLWLDLSKTNSESITAYQFQVCLTDDEGNLIKDATMALEFDNSLKDAVKNASFEQTTGVMTIYVADTKNLVQVGDRVDKLLIGSVTVTPKSGAKLYQYKLNVNGNTGNLMTVAADHSTTTAATKYATGDDQNPFTINADGTLLGTPEKFNITTKTDGNGTLTTTVDNKAVTTSIDKYSTVTVKASPKTGYAMPEITVTDALGTTIRVLNGGTFELKGNTTIDVQFTKITEACKITVENGKIISPSTSEVALNTIVKIRANAPESGKKFSHWAYEDGSILSYKDGFSFYAKSSVKLTAVYVDSSVVIEKKPVISMEPTARISAQADGKYTLSYSGVLVVLEGYEVIENGLVFTNQESAKPDDNFTIGGKINGVGVLKYVAFSPNNSGQFFHNIVNVKGGQTRVGRYYAIIKKDGIQSTIYSDTIVLSKTPV